jgi:hypothetical protein
MSGEIIRHGAQVLKEAPDSPDISKEEFSTRVTRTFTGPYEVCLASQPTAGSYMANGDWRGMRIASVNVRKQKMERGILIIIYEGSIILPGGVRQDPLPKDECSVDFEEQQFALENHPNYNPKTSLLTRDDIACVRASPDASSAEDREEYYERITGLILNEATEKEGWLANDLYLKLLKGITHFVFFAPVYKWTSYFWNAPLATAGGFPQLPYGPIPPPQGFDWLRKGDTLHWNGNHWVLQRTWIACFELESDLYPVSGVPVY